MGPVRIRHSSHDFGWQSSHSVDLAGWQAKMASIEIWIPWRNAHKPHCIIRVWVRDVASGPGSGLVHTTLLCRNSEAHSSCHPLQFSSRLFLLESFFFWWFLDFSSGQSFFFFFFLKEKLCNSRATLQRPVSRSTCTAHRMRSHCITQKKPTLQEKSRKLAYWQDRTLSRRKLLVSEREHRCRSSATPGWDQLSPSCSPVAQNWAAVFFFLIICLFDSFVGSVNGVLVSFGSTVVTWRTLSGSVAIHSPGSIHARCPWPWKSLPGLTLFSFFSFFFFLKKKARRSSLHSSS